MRRLEDYRRHAANVQRETKNPAILKDVAGGEFEQDRANSDPLSSSEKISQNNIDGKTWSNTDF